MLSLPRSVLCARITALRRALDELKLQAEADGQGAIPGYGALKVSLITHENDLRERDRQAIRGEPMPLPVALAAVSATVARHETPVRSFPTRFFATRFFAKRGA